MLTEIKRVRWQTLLLCVVLHNALKPLLLSEAFVRVTMPLRDALGGVLSVTVLTYLVELVLLLGLLRFAEGLRLRDLGLDRRHLLNAAIFVTLLWGLKQIALWLATRVFAPVAPDPWLLRHLGDAAFWGRLVEVWFGAALFEEVFYRGFLLMQLFLLAEHRWPHRRGLTLGLSVVLTQAYFGLNHLQAGVSFGLHGSMLAAYVMQVSLVGVFLAFVFLRTGNLFLAIGIHALLNHPLPLFASSVDPALVVLAQAGVLLFAWPWMYRVYDEVFTMQPAFAPPGVLRSGTSR
ncbi:MAG: CPBP family intramembrane metalloprotease [Bacteroidetes bacterium]|nr:CPBP family intramembrane metalloprotease [Rhodothermaceae bacterium RA]RMH66955.1 MAG: CPBP family intramembrane metalloprotease [Bacteroidota bacterium]